MAKGDDAKMKKKNKAMRKKLQKDPSSVSARVAAMIAAKKRRLSGKRRQCQGMCFSLPTAEDPFNDRHGKADNSMNKIKKPLRQSNKGSLKDTGDGKVKRTTFGDQENINHQKEKRLNNKVLENQQKTSVGNSEKRAELGKRKTLNDVGNLISENSGCPSKFIFMCLNTIRDSLLGDGELNEELDEPLFIKSWGVNFWKSYSLGHDILENSGTGASIQQIAWTASTAADRISQMEKEDVSFNSPFLLYLVSSQEKAVKVRSICKPLKSLGIHTVILHPGTAIEHQVHGLKSCEPEFLVATPERLWELVALKAVDISSASFLVVDGMDSLSNCHDVIKSIKDSISGKHRTVVFQGCWRGSSVLAAKNILTEPFHTLSLDESIKIQDHQSSAVRLNHRESHLRKTDRLVQCR